MPMARLLWNQTVDAVTPSGYAHPQQMPDSLQSSDIVDQMGRYATTLEYHLHGHPRALLMPTALPDHCLHHNTPCTAQARSIDRPIQRTHCRTIARTLLPKGHNHVEHLATINDRLPSHASNTSPCYQCRFPIVEQLPSTPVLSSP